MPLLDEAALRKPGFAPGVRLRFADGQDWEVPPAVYQLYPRFTPDGIVVAAKLTFGPELEYFLDLDDSPTGEEGVEYVRRQFEIMARLLLANYDLTPDDLGRLLTLNRADPESAEMWAAIDRFLIGQPPGGGEPPKPSADGSD
jgi:hypothetical protein